MTLHLNSLSPYTILFFIFVDGDYETINMNVINTIKAQIESISGVAINFTNVLNLGEVQQCLSHPRWFTNCFFIPTHKHEN
jgi:hypothetical protein